VSLTIVGFHVIMVTVEILSSEMWYRVIRKFTEVSKNNTTSIFRVGNTGKRETTDSTQFTSQRTSIIFMRRVVWLVTLLS
jgi:hypothetical protein